MCKKGAWIFQRIHPKVEGSGSPSGTPNDGERDDHNNSRHITSVLLWKMVGYTPSRFADLVFTYERIEMGLKRRKFNHPAWTNEKTGANEEGENEGETHVVTVIPIRPSFPPTQQTSLLSQYRTFSLPTTQSSTKAIPKINHKAYLPHFQWQTPPLA